LRLAAVQYKAPKGAFQSALQDIARLAEEAAAGADLVVFPEMAATGYLFESTEEIAAVAEPAKGPSFAVLGPIAAAHGTWIVFGFPEECGGRYFNSALVISPQGELAFCYRKSLLYERDLPWATPGDSGYRVFEASWGRFGVGICMDLNDEGFVDWIRVMSLDVIAFPTNWVEEGIDVWAYWGWRLQGCSAALVAANTYGPEEDIQFAGRSAIMRSNTIYAAAPRTGAGVIRASFDG
jgi:predicted amidohydrolase